MLEYVFFQEMTRKRFQDFLTGQGLAWALEPGNLETLVIVDEAGLDDELAERVESIYDELFSMEQSLHDASSSASARVDAENGVVIQLKDGRAVRASLPPELIHRLLTVITAQELGALVDVIARALEHPDERGR
jgi:hypothetical protein